MPVINSIAAEADTLTAWRRHLHQQPELLFDCVKTAAFVVEQLESFGIAEIHTGIAQTGVVAIIEGREPGRTIGLRADMDALPMEDLSGTEHASKIPGMAHTCGHDGHTTMLLGAAKYLAETRNFAGRVALLFQPAEEGGGGGKVMVDEGIMDRFDIEEVYGIHNAPGEPEGHIVTAPGPLMASADEFRIDIEGVGGHGAEPQESVDPIPAASAMVQALQSIVSRNVSASTHACATRRRISASSARPRASSTRRATCRLSRELRLIAMLARSRVKVFIATIQPSFSAPTRFAFGVRTPSKKISPNSSSPVICASGFTVTPGDVRSTTIAEMPLCRGASGSVRANKRHSDACRELLDQIFWPVTT